MRELKLRYFIELASNIGAKARAEAQEVERSQRTMQSAVDKTSGALRGLESAYTRLAGNTATERQIGYMRRLGQGIEQATTRARNLAQTLTNAIPKAVGVAGGVTGAFFASKALLDKPMDYSMRLAHMSNTAFRERDLQGRQAGKAELDATIVKAVRFGGGTRDQGAATLDALIASGAVPIETAKKMLPSLMKASSASGTDSSAIANIAIKAMQTFKITEAQLPEVLDIAMKAGQAGGFELRDMAKWLPQMMAAGKLSGLQGVEGFRRIVSGAQASAITSGSKDEAGNNVVNLLAKINSQDTQKDFKKEGYDLTGKLMAAREKGVNSIDAFVSFVDEIAAKDPQYVALRKKLAAATTMDEKTETTEALASLLEGSAVGKVIQDRQALMYLLAEMNNRDYIKDVMGKTRSPGSAIDSAQALISGESSYKAEQIANNRDIAMSQAYGAGSPLKALMDGANWASEKFPLLTAAVVGTTAALGVFATALIAFGLAGRGVPGVGVPRVPGALPTAALPGSVSASGVAAASGFGRALGLVSKLLGPVSMLFALEGISDEDIARLHAYEAKKARNGGGSGVRGQGFDDPRRLDSLALSAPGQAASQLAAGQSAKIELGQGQLDINVLVTQQPSGDWKTTAMPSVVRQPSAIRINPGDTNPGGFKR